GDIRSSVNGQPEVQLREEVDWGLASPGAGDGRLEEHEGQQIGRDQEHLEEFQGPSISEENHEGTEVRDHIGVIDPEEIMHKGDNHNHNDEDTGSVHGGGGEGEASQDKVEKMIESGAARAQAEVEELNILRPNIWVNVHDLQARSAVDSLKTEKTRQKFWENKELLRRSIGLMTCYVFSVFNYGCEAWTYFKPVQKKIRAFEMWCYRRLLKVPWTEKKNNKEIKRMGDVGERLLQQLMQRKLGYA
ncbi:endonuclease-reverse transcriptase, partial [Elysia marginata]